MSTTGFLLREAIRRYELRRDTAAQQFTDSLMKFEGETKRTPAAITEDFLYAERAISSLQAAQSRYNLMVEVDVLGEKITLCEAVKRLGGAGRIEKMWRTAAGGGKTERYSFNREDVRREGETRAARTVSVEDAMARTCKLSAQASALRAAVATGNATQIAADRISLDPKLLTE